jgi:Protein of unknown function (DUF3572)
MREPAVRLKQPKPAPLDRAAAEALAAEAMAFLTADGARLARFLGDSGLDPPTLAAALANGGANGGDGVLDAALDHVVSDESLLLVFASEVRRKPEEVMAARALLAGPAPYASI